MYYRQYIAAILSSCIILMAVSAICIGDENTNESWNVYSIYVMNELDRLRIAIEKLDNETTQKNHDLSNKLDNINNSINRKVEENKVAIAEVQEHTRTYSAIFGGAVSVLITGSASIYIAKRNGKNGRNNGSGQSNGK